MRPGTWCAIRAVRTALWLVCGTSSLWHGAAGWLWLRLLGGLGMLFFQHHFSHQVVHLLTGLGHHLTSLVCHGKACTYRTFDGGTHVVAQFRKKFAQQNGTGTNDQARNEFHLNQGRTHHDGSSRGHRGGVTRHEVFATCNQVAEAGRGANRRVDWLGWMMGNGGIAVGGGGLFPGLDARTNYWREVGLIIRERATQAVVFESRATHDGPWSDSNAILPAMLDAALQGFPNPPAGERRVNIEIPR